MAFAGGKRHSIGMIERRRWAEDRRAAERNLPSPFARRAPQPRVAALAIATLLAATLLAACTPESAPEIAPARAVVADAAFCAQIRTTGAKLSEYLAPVATLMGTSTGVYTLEEGDVSMVARAWLTEAAERTIDVQYFIFTCLLYTSPSPRD